MIKFTVKKVEYDKVFGEEITIESVENNNRKDEE